jgi:arsenate reductase
MTQIYHRHDITLDQVVALKTAATRLERDFDGTFNTETIERFLHSSYDQFAGHATIANFLPLLAERFARQRLHALAKVEGRSHDGRPTVLFLCTHNAGRSQMAMGFFVHHAGGAAVAWSGGSEPGNRVNPAAIAAMKERGIDISTEYPKPWTDEIVRAADVVITMGCGDACPVFPGKRYEEWTLDDPAGLDLAAVRPIRDKSNAASSPCSISSASRHDSSRDHASTCRRPTGLPVEDHDRYVELPGLTARTMAACMPGAASWVKLTSASTKPAAISPSRYSWRDRAPAIQPT